jgi:peptidoglycan/xylan/chitin deacetylase (PgdA/CDA1 family)
MRLVARKAIIYGLWWSGATAWARRRLRREKAIVVLMFHRVLSEESRRETHSELPMIVAANKFAALMEYLAKNYRVVDVMKDQPEFEDDRLGIGLTLDDGWLDNYEPVMEAKARYGHASTIFLSPALVGKVNPFWPERVAELMQGAAAGEVKEVVEDLKVRLPVERAERLREMEIRFGGLAESMDGPDRTMTWDHIHEMRAAGITFGAHSQNHEILTSLPGRTEVDRELKESKRDLEVQLGRDCDVMAYPNGGHSDTVVEWTGAAGYRRAFTVQTGAWTEETHPLRIPRMNVSDARVSFGDEFSPAAFEFSVVFRAYLAFRRQKAAEASRRAVTPAFAASQSKGEGRVTPVTARTEH